MLVYLKIYQMLIFQLVNQQAKLISCPIWKLNINYHTCNFSRETKEVNVSSYYLQTTFLKVP